MICVQRWSVHAQMNGQSRWSRVVALRARSS
jgi:hypothetical protein